MVARVHWHSYGAETLPNWRGDLWWMVFLGIFDNASFSDRIKASTEAKAALVEKLRARPGLDDPRILANNAERRATHEARLARQAERQVQQAEKLAQDAEERRGREAQELAAARIREAELEEAQRAAEAAKLERAANVQLNLADQKALRDERYAARKARQRR